MKRLVSGCAVVVLLLLIAGAGPAEARPPCSHIGQGDCNAVCYLLGGSCNSWSLGSCSSDSAPYTYHCSTTNFSDYCTCSSGDDGGGGCFLAGTEITMADGTGKAIEQIEAGDVVLAFDQASGAMKPDPVKQVHEPMEVDHYLVINGDLRVTPSHPVLSDGKWIDVGALEVGDSLTAADGSDVVIESIEVLRGPVTVYNFAVNPYGTYVAGGIVAHNRKEVVKEQDPNGP